MKNKFVVYFLVYAALVFLTGFFARYMKFLAASPEFFLIFLAAASFREGPLFGAIFGFFAGIFADFVSVYLPGSHCLLYTTVGYVCGLLSGKFYTDFAQNRLLATLSVSVFIRLGLWLIGETFGVGYAPSPQWVSLTFLYNIIAAGPLFRVAAACRRIGAETGGAHSRR